MSMGMDMYGAGVPPMDPMMAPPMEEPMEEEVEDSISLLNKALKLVRQATDTEDDPQMSLQIEKISTLIQQAIASDYGAGMKAMGMDPMQARLLRKAR